MSGYRPKTRKADLVFRTTDDRRYVHLEIVKEGVTIFDLDMSPADAKHLAAHIMQQALSLEP